MAEDGGLIGGLLGGGETEAADADAAAGLDPIAAALATSAAERGQPLDPRLASYLASQEKLVEIQTEHLHEQREVLLANLKLKRWSERLKLGVGVFVAGVATTVVVALGVVAWQASRAHALEIDAFSVPPDLARDGLTGQVAASRFFDKLQDMQTATKESDRPAQSYKSGWGSDIKVEIPETGLTFGEFEKLLREKIGHVSHVTGEVVRTQDQIALTVRLGETPPRTFTGSAADFDALAQKSAETVYRANEPYRYAEYLEGEGRLDEAFAVISDLAAKGPRSERGWAYSKWAQLDLNYHADIQAADRHSVMGLGFTPSADLNARIAQVNTAVWSGHEQDDRDLSLLIDKLAQQRQPDASELFFQENKLLSRAWLLFVLSDYAGAADAWKAEDESDHSGRLAPQMVATAQALDHDPAAARATLAKAAQGDEPGLLWDIARGAFLALPNYWIAADEGNWRAALDDARATDAALEAGKAARPIYGLMQKVWIWPLEALAQGRSGDFAGAQALIEKTPLDCYPCLTARGQIQAMRGDAGASDRWFQAAARQGPSLPLAYQAWGEARLARGDLRGAAWAFGQAAQRGPKWADPPKGLGDVAARRGQWRAALAFYDEAFTHAAAWAELKQARAAAASH